MRRHPLPSLTSLRAFEAYARHGRLVAAADELCVTHGAVSRQIKNLERQLGAALLTGHPGKVVLTETGERFGGELTRLFDELSAISGSLREAKPTRLQILCPGSFAMRWLIPHVQDFKLAHPEIDLEIADSNGPWLAAAGGPHGAIRIRGYEGIAQAHAREFMGRAFGPVVSPEVYATLGDNIAGLLALPRLWIRSIPTDWDDWAAAAALDLPFQTLDQGFDRSFHMLEAAMNGLGVCIADHAYVAAHVETGKLIAPLGFVPSPRSYVFLRAERCRNLSVDLFQEWLVECAAGPVA